MRECTLETSHTGLDRSWLDLENILKAWRFSDLVRSAALLSRVHQEWPEDMAWADQARRLSGLQTMSGHETAFFEGRRETLLAAFSSRLYHAACMPGDPTSRTCNRKHASIHKGECSDFGPLAFIAFVLLAIQVQALTPFLLIWQSSPLPAFVSWKQDPGSSLMDHFWKHAQVT